MTTATQQFEKPELSYRYEFEKHELDAIRACVHEHGFAVVKRVLPLDYVEELRLAALAVVNPRNGLQPGESRTVHAFVEHCPVLWRLLDDEEFVNFSRFMLGTPDLTLHRSASIVRMPGSPGMQWHTDMSFNEGPPKNLDDVLNRSMNHFSGPFYLTGLHPMNAGLAVIPGSHRADWPGPEGFEFTPDRRSFFPRGTEPKGYGGMDVPGMLPLFTDPGDRTLFHGRTYHGVFPHKGTEIRVSCGVGFRPKHPRITPPWPLSTYAKNLMASLPQRLKPLYEDYIGIDPAQQHVY
ncbi:MAG: phytanoyl-CoA dioxygenase family protein [Planctomycetes bacterium]|nr:phytanoyl-CoA dioxygenase family protein [Planctomycetota bacterium]